MDEMYIGWFEEDENEGMGENIKNRNAWSVTVTEAKVPQGLYRSAWSVGR